MLVLEEKVIAFEFPPKMTDNMISKAISWTQRLEPPNTLKKYKKKMTLANVFPLSQYRPKEIPKSLTKNKDF